MNIYSQLHSFYATNVNSGLATRVTLDKNVMGGGGGGYEGLLNECGTASYQFFCTVVSDCF
jgi:hypothetical protein